MNIIVTGASRGIGAELVKIFSANSDNYIIAIASNGEKLNALKEECLKINKNAKVETIVCDFAKAEQINSLIIEIKKLTPVIDILINNAGKLLNKPFLEIQNEDLISTYQVNVFSVMKLIQGIIPMMTAEKKAHIVNISSMGGFQGSMKFAGLSGYSSSKAALACLTECLAEDFKDKNIAFNCLALGAADTEMLREAFPNYKAPVSASEMAKYISHFALSAHHYMNGKIIPVSLSTP